MTVTKRPEVPMLARVALTTCAAASAALVALPSPAYAGPSDDRGSQGQGSEHRPSSRPTPASTRPTPQGSKGGSDRADERRDGARGEEQRTRPTPRRTGSADQRSGNGQGNGNGAGQANGRQGPDRGTGDTTDPRGNNGTIKIDFLNGVDSGNANRPHPGCGFTVRMFNFDAGQTGTLVITGQAPTAVGTVLTRQLLLSSDAAGGGQDVDESYSFTAAELGLSAADRAAQGWHLKVAVNADGAPGGAKQKVFWLDCESGPVLGGTLPGSSLVKLPSGLTPVQANLIRSEIRLAAQSASAPQVTTLPEQAPTKRSLVGGGGGLRGMQLPFTGIELWMLLAAAAASLGGGALAVRAGRRRTTA